MELSGNIEIMPWEVAKPECMVVFGRTRKGYRNGFEPLSREVGFSFLNESGKEMLLVKCSCEAYGMMEFASFIKDSDDSFGAADINTEIHIFILACYDGWISLYFC